MFSSHRLFSGYDIYQTALYHNHLLDLLLSYDLCYLLSRKRTALDLFIRQTAGDHELLPQFAVDLDDEFDLLLLGDLLIPYRPAFL